MIDYLSQKNKDTGRIIRKKVLPEFFKGIESCEKTFEIRKDEDDIHAGDILVLAEWDGKNFTGNTERRVVTSVLRDAHEYGLMDGYCILSLQKLDFMRFYDEDYKRFMENRRKMINQTIERAKRGGYEDDE